MDSETPVETLPREFLAKYYFGISEREERKMPFNILVTFHESTIRATHIFYPEFAGWLNEGNESRITICTILYKRKNGEYERVSGYSICHEVDQWDDVIGMRAALANILRFMPNQFAKSVWKVFVKRIVKEAQRIGK